MKLLTAKCVTQVLQGAALIVAGGLFIFQVCQHLLHFFRHAPTISVSLDLPQTLHLPNIFICPHQPFNPIALRDFGLNIQDPLPNQNIEEILKNILNFQGLDDSLAARDVWETAGFFLGEVVHSLSFGDIIENYTRQTKSSPYWERVLSPLGTCLSLLLPSLTSHAVHLPKLMLNLHKKIYTTTCLFSPYHCTPTEAKICNSTCTFEKFIAQASPMPYDILLQKVYPTHLQNMSNQLEENLRYILSDEVWHSVRLGVDREPLNVIEIHTTVVDKHPLNCHYPSDELSALDFSTCIDKKIEAESGCLPVRPYFNLTLKTSCNVTVIQNLASNNVFDQHICFTSLKNKCSQKHWEYEIRHGQNMTAFVAGMYQLHLELASSKIRIETEVDMYPPSQLFSDIGGSLGLCLGMSLLTIWKCIRPNTAIPEPDAGQRLNIKHCQYLTYWSIVVILAFTMVAHGFILLQNFITQPKMTSVTKAMSSASINSSDNYNSIHDHVAARLAARALDCQPGPYSPKEQCLLDCLMKRAVKQVSSVAPFVEMQDLPFCPIEPSWTYSPVYVVPSLAYTTATDPYIITQCKQRCAHMVAGNVSDTHPLSGLQVNHKYYHMTVGDLLCGLAGIMGLYAGLFLSSAIPRVIRLIPKTSSNALCLQLLVKRVLESVIYLSGASLTVLLLHRYIFCHPISSFNSEQVLSVDKQYMLTVCHWPPFTTELRENDSLNLDEQWKVAAWQEAISRVAVTSDLGSILHKTDDYNVTSGITMLNRCDSVTAKVLYNNFITSLFYWLNFNDFIILSIHDINAPPFVSTLYRVHDLESITLTVIPTSYTRLTHQANHDSNYDECLYHCIHNHYMNVMGCRLPFIMWRPDLPQCNLDTAQQHPYWPTEPPHQPMMDNEDSSTCHKLCRKYLTKFFLVSAKPGAWIESGVNIIQQRGSYATIEEDDWYQFWNLFNDLGVVVGFTFGTSILSFLQAIINAYLPTK